MDPLSSNPCCSRVSRTQQFDYPPFRQWASGLLPPLATVTDATVARPCKYLLESRSSVPSGVYLVQLIAGSYGNNSSNFLGNVHTNSPPQLHQFALPPAMHKAPAPHAPRSTWVLLFFIVAVLTGARWRLLWFSFHFSDDE